MKTKYAIDIRELGLGVIERADQIYQQPMVNNEPRGNLIELYNSKKDGHVLIIQADSTADLLCALELLVEAVKGK